VRAAGWFWGCGAAVARDEVVSSAAAAEASRATQTAETPPAA